jgi:hypothetical protein
MYDEFRELMKQAISNSKNDGKIHYIYVGSDGEGFETTKYMGIYWWFKVYPGGRKTLSPEGQKRLNE